MKGGLKLQGSGKVEHMEQDIADPLLIRYRKFPSFFGKKDKIIFQSASEQMIDLAVTVGDAQGIGEGYSKFFPTVFPGCQVIFV